MKKFKIPIIIISYAFVLYVGNYYGKNYLANSIIKKYGLPDNTHEIFMTYSIFKLMQILKEGTTAGQ